MAEVEASVAHGGSVRQNINPTLLIAHSNECNPIGYLEGTEATDLMKPGDMRLGTKTVISPHHACGTPSETRFVNAFLMLLRYKDS